MEIFDYDNILLLPRKCRVESRSECDASVELGGHKFRLPVVPANMKTVVDEKICLWMAKNNYFYVMHRFDLDNVQFVRDMHSQGVYASISLGVKAPDRAAVDQLAAENLAPEFITIDIAHGHADSVRDMIAYIKDKLPTSFVIAGNVATPEAVIDLENWGADATKVGVGPGKVCITKLKTGFGTGGWQLSALKWCARVATKPIIADGGIRNHGDIAKSIRFGASMVMIGSLFAGHEESPGKTVEVDGEVFKEYYGSASDFNKGEYKHVEGKRILEPIKGQLANTLIVVTSDNGRPFPREKGNLYEAANHLPFAVMWKNGIRSPGREVRDYISFLDLAPTFLEAAGIPWSRSAMAAPAGTSLIFDDDRLP